MRLISLLVVWFGLSLFYDRSGYWSSNRTPSSMAIGPAIEHVVKCQSDSWVYLCVNVLLAFCAVSSVQSDSDIFSTPVGQRRSR